MSRSSPVLTKMHDVILTRVQYQIIQSKKENIKNRSGHIRIDESVQYRIYKVYNITLAKEDNIPLFKMDNITLTKVDNIH